MADELVIPQTTDKKTRYELLIPQIEALVSGEPDLIANLANIASVLKFGMDFFWVGFYLVKDDELVLGPFQGPIACTRIRRGKGVCGQAWERGETIIVSNVDEFPGHIACSSDSKSEIVIPFYGESGVAMVLDVDSDDFNSFDEIDQAYLSKISGYLQLKNN